MSVKSNLYVYGSNPQSDETLEIESMHKDETIHYTKNG